MTMTRETDAETIATLRAQLDSTLKDRALIMDERDAAQLDLLLLTANKDAAHERARQNLTRAEAAEARLAELDAENARLLLLLDKAVNGVWINMYLTEARALLNKEPKP
jgi:hypothetical protein